MTSPEDEPLPQMDDTKHRQPQSEIRLHEVLVVGPRELDRNGFANLEFRPDGHQNFRMANPPDGWRDFAHQILRWMDEMDTWDSPSKISN